MSATQDWPTKYARMQREWAERVQHYREHKQSSKCVPVDSAMNFYAVTTTCRRRNVLALIQLTEWDAEALESLCTEDEKGELAMRLAELHGWQDVVAERPSSLTGETRVTLERVFLS